MTVIGGEMKAALAGAHTSRKLSGRYDLKGIYVLHYKR
jgi:hypothetical protein